MITRKWPSVFGTIRHLYFANSVHPQAGHLIQAEKGVPGRLNDWWDIRELRYFPYYSLAMILENGSGTYRNQNEYSCSLSYGDFILSLPGFYQYYGPGKDEHWSELCVSFSGRMFDVQRECGVLNCAQPVWRLENPAFWTARLQTLLEQPRPVCERGLVREAAQFLAFLLELQEHAIPKTEEQAFSDWFTQAVVMLTNDLSQKPDLQVIAAELGMSYHTFRVSFARRAGMPPAQYRNCARLQAACHFLKTTENTGKDIAFHTGYATVQHFSADIKKWTGMTPSAYRRTHFCRETKSNAD